jgi:hypothetical protein
MGELHRVSDVETPDIVANLMRSRLYDATQVFFMGVGDAYLGLVDLLSHNGKHLTILYHTPH